MIAGSSIAGAPIAGTLTESATVTAPTIQRPLFLLVDTDGRGTIVDNEGRTMTDFWIKRGDTSPVFSCQLLDGDARPVDITDATVRLKARNRAGAQVIDAAMTVDSATTGLVRYAWVAGDTATQSELSAEVQVTFADSTIQTWPNPGFVAVHVTSDVAA